MERQLRKSNIVKNGIIAGLTTIIYHANIVEFIPVVTKAIGVTMFFTAGLLILMYFDALLECMEEQRDAKRRHRKEKKEHDSTRQERKTS